MKGTTKYTAGGNITLIYSGDFIERRNYNCVSERNKIIEGWKVRFKHQWDRCSFLINPQVDITRINPDGTNVKWKMKLVSPYDNSDSKVKPLTTVRNPYKKFKYNAVSPSRLDGNYGNR